MKNGSALVADANSETVHGIGDKEKRRDYMAIFDTKSDQPNLNDTNLSFDELQRIHKGQNIRIGKLNHPIADIIRQHMSEGQKGRKLSEETRRKISKRLTGRKTAPETRKKQRLAWERIKQDPQRYMEIRSRLSRARKISWARRHGILID